MKKERSVQIIPLLALVFILLSVSFVSAASGSTVTPNRIIQDIIAGSQSTFGPIFTALLGGEDEINGLLFSRILIFILIFSVVFIVLSRVDLFGGKRSIVLVVAGVVSILSVRYLKAGELITAILMPYGAMGAAITVFLPFIIYFFFVHDAVPGSFGRRAAWAVFGLFFIAFLLYNTYSGDTGDYGGYSWIYWIGLILVFLCFIFDKTIHSYFVYSDFERAKDTIDSRARLQALEDLHKAKEYGTARDVKRIEARNRQMGFDFQI